MVRAPVPLDRRDPGLRSPAFAQSMVPLAGSVSSSAVRTNENIPSPATLAKLDQDEPESQPAAAHDNRACEQAYEPSAIHGEAASHEHHTEDYKNHNVGKAVRDPVMAVSEAMKLLSGS